MKTGIGILALVAAVIFYDLYTEVKPHLTEIVENKATVVQPDKTERALVDEILLLQDYILRLEEEVKQGRHYQTYQVTVTAYTGDPAENDSDPSHTATMTTPKLGDIAVSRDLEWMLGSKVKIEDVGMKTATDLMNPRYSMRIDIYMGNGRQAKQNAKEFGVQHLNLVCIGKEI